MLAFVVSLMMTSFDPSLLTVPIAHAEEIDTGQEVWLDALQKCENENHVKKILDTNDKYSYGDFMFQMGTWVSFGKVFGATRENISDNDLQRIVARDMLSKGLWRHWFTCGKIIQKSLGAFPNTVSTTSSSSF